MADLTITAASVLPGSGATIKHGTSGATITAGKAVAQDPSNGKYMLADSNSALEWTRRAKGIALNAASDGQPIAVLTDGPITIGATVSGGIAYYLSDTPGGVCPVADVGSGEYTVLIGVATSASVIDVDIQYSGVAQ